MRVVLDPGVVVSALIAPKGAPGQLLDRLLEDRFDIVVSQRLLDELTGVLLRAKFRRYASPAEVHQLVAELSAIAIMADDPPDPPSVTRDPGDDYLVALAVAAGADALVSRCSHRERSSSNLRLSPADERHAGP